MMEEWLGSHSYGVPSPWETGDADMSDLDDYCFLAPAE